jgi:hypothetical protein
VSALTSWLTMQSVDREAKRLDAMERATRQPDNSATAPVPAPTAPGPGTAPAGTRVEVTPMVPTQPQTAPAFPPPVVINRLPGGSTPRPATQAWPPLLTPQ